MSQPVAPTTGLTRRLRRLRWSLRRRLGPSRPTVVDYDLGLRLRVRPVDRLGKRIYLDGYSDREHAAFLHATLRPGMCYFDVGANFGQFSVLAGRLVGPTGAVHAFEATSRMFAELTANAQLNSQSHVHPNHAAVSDRPGELSIRVPAPGRESFSSIGQPMPRAGETTVVETVAAITLDDYCAEHGVEAIDVLKLDIEGSEAAALRGARRLLSEGRVRLVVCEINERALQGMGASSVEVRRTLEAEGYRLYRFDPQRLTLTPEPAHEAYDETENLVALRDAAAVTGLTILS